MLAGHRQAIAGQTTCPFDLNAWRILHPPKLSAHDLYLLSIFLRVSKNYGVKLRLRRSRFPDSSPLLIVIGSYLYLLGRWASRKKPYAN